MSVGARMVQTSAKMGHSANRLLREKMLADKAS